MSKGINPNARLPLLIGPIPDAENVHPRVVGGATFNCQGDAKASFPINDKIPRLEVFGLNFFWYSAAGGQRKNQRGKDQGFENHGVYEYAKQRKCFDKFV